MCCKGRPTCIAMVADKNVAIGPGCILLCCNRRRCVALQWRTIDERAAETLQWQTEHCNNGQIKDTTGHCNIYQWDTLP